MSSSTKYNFMLQKFKAMILFEFLDKYPSPIKLKEVEEQSSSYNINFNNRYCFGLEDCLIELMWIRERMLAAKNMNATRQIIFWDKINLKYESHLRWLFDWVKEKAICFSKHSSGDSLSIHKKQ